VSEPPTGVLPSLAEVKGWVGSDLDDVDGGRVGRVVGVYADTEGGAPVWLVIAIGPQGSGRFSLGRRAAKTVVIPLRECAAMPGCVWTAQAAGTVRAAPTVDPSRPLLREHEASICTHYGIGERVGRHAELSMRPADSITAQPA
jgi:hypothetical protein